MDEKNSPPLLTDLTTLRGVSLAVASAFKIKCGSGNTF